MIAIFILQNATNTQVYGNKIPSFFSEKRNSSLHLIAKSCKRIICKEPWTYFAQLHITSTSLY